MIASGGVESRASETNYQPYVIGERALAMGGAYTAAVNDAMAGFYNPGGLAFADTSMVSASQRLYGRYRLKIKDAFYPQSPQAMGEGAQDAANLGSTYSFVLPSTLALMMQFGKRLSRRGPRRHALGFSILVPTQTSFTVRAKWKGMLDPPDEETYSLKVEDRSIWSGFTYALRANKEFSIGVSGFLTQTSSSRRLDRSWIIHPENPETCAIVSCGTLSFSESLLRTDVVSLLFRLGTLWAPYKELRLGLMLSLPSIIIPDLWLVSTEGSLDQTYGASSANGVPTDRTVFYTDDYKLDVAHYDPLSFRLGLAYLRNEDLTLAIDGSLHFPISYAFIRGNPVADRAQADDSASPSWFDASIVRRTERRWTFNGNTGAEWDLSRHFSLRGGIYSDFSSTPKVVASTRPSLPHINRVGGVASVGFRQDGYNITIGVVGVLGAGQVSVYRPLEAQSSGGLAWGPADYRERGIYLFIAGIQRAAARKAKELLEDIEELQLQKEQEEKEETQKAQRAAAKEARRRRGEVKPKDTGG
ncbi:MAG: hypothetical protein MUC50_22395 [Myxococcota bacterium]|nr:hypothetical protein [Myxococcota bacterium]